jgi:hypothetical protein
MRIDESRHRDHIRSVDHLGRGLETGLDRDDLRALDQHVRSLKVADVWIEREHAAALQQDTAPAYPGRAAAVALAVCGQGSPSQHLGCDGASHEPHSARCEEMAARHPAIAGQIRIALVHSSVARLRCSGSRDLFAHVFVLR